MGAGLGSGQTNAKLTDTLQASVSIDYGELLTAHYNGTGTATYTVPAGKKWIVVSCTLCAAANALIRGYFSDGAETFLSYDDGTTIAVGAFPIMFEAAEYITIYSKDAAFSYYEIDA